MGDNPEIRFAEPNEPMPPNIPKKKPKRRLLMTGMIYLYDKAIFWLDLQRDERSQPDPHCFFKTSMGLLRSEPRKFLEKFRVQTQDTTQNRNTSEQFESHSQEKCLHSLRSLFTFYGSRQLRGQGRSGVIAILLRSAPNLIASK